MYDCAIVVVVVAVVVVLLVDCLLAGWLDCSLANFIVFLLALWVGWLVDWFVFRGMGGGEGGVRSFCLLLSCVPLNEYDSGADCSLQLLSVRALPSAAPSDVRLHSMYAYPCTR